MGEQVSLKFLFANHDGVTVAHTCGRDVQLGALKEALLKAWPAGVPPAEVGQLRLICMGRDLCDDGRTIEDCQLPAFEAHGTPINVAIRPKHRVVEPPPDAGLTKTPSRNNAGAGVRASNGCCTVS